MLSDLLAQKPFLYYINALIMFQNTPIYIHDIHILWKNIVVCHIKI